MTSTDSEGKTSQTKIQSCWTYHYKCMDWVWFILRMWGFITNNKFIPYMKETNLSTKKQHISDIFQQQAEPGKERWLPEHGRIQRERRWWSGHRTAHSHRHVQCWSGQRRGPWPWWSCWWPSCKNKQGLSYSNQLRHTLFSREWVSCVPLPGDVEVHHRTLLVLHGGGWRGSTTTATAKGRKKQSTQARRVSNFNC